MSSLTALATLIRDSRGVRHKTDIAAVVDRLGLGAGDRIAVGDDMAVIPHGDTHLLLSIEGFVADFVAADPWFAGYCGVMVNLADVAAMGGRAIAVVDALWSDGAEASEQLLDGLREAARRYGVPIVGGHSNVRAKDGQLAAAILGEAIHPVTSFDARPGDALIVATDLRGAFRDPFPWWDASTTAPAERLRGDLEILPRLAEEGLLTGAKDISMAGPVGTVMMLAEASGVGATVMVDRLPKPAGVSIERWMAAFPSFGFVLTARTGVAGEVLARFRERGIHAEVAGAIDDTHRVAIERDGERAPVWNFTERFTGCAVVAHHREPAHA